MGIFLVLTEIHLCILTLCTSSYLPMNLIRLNMNRVTVIDQGGIALPSLLLKSQPWTAVILLGFKLLISQQ